MNGGDWDHERALDRALDTLASFDPRHRFGREGLGLVDACIYVGQHERAKGLIRRVTQVGPEVALARWNARDAFLELADGRDLDRAVRQLEDAASCTYRDGDPAEASTLLLDSAELLLLRDGPSETSVASHLLDLVRPWIPKLERAVFSEWFELDSLWVRAQTGNPRGEISGLLALRDARGQRIDELTLRVDAVLMQVSRLAGLSEETAQHLESLRDHFERMATLLPRELRATFASSPIHRWMLRRDRERPTAKTSRSQPGMLSGRVMRLLDITRRLAAEHDLSRLLMRITDSAVELSGAERGFVLLPGASGSLEPAVVHDVHAPEDPHVVFSRSIAEAVLIDGEPIVTFDAGCDTRLSEYVSVHKLMLQSVACIPIRDSSAVRGVLYVEHRVRRGRFDEQDVELLLALADQAAIALSNARLLEENRKKQTELEAAKLELERTNQEIDRLLQNRTEELEEAVRELRKAKRELSRMQGRYGLVGKSEALRKVVSIVERVAASHVPVVIFGESGTGKELVARAVHDASRRAGMPFLAVNCAAIPEALLESELFGHSKGAFTGAERDRVGYFVQANGGTLFLDEVGDMTPKMQVELLRVLADGIVRPLGSESDLKVDVRVVCASNKNLRELVKKGSFREDLFYRLSVVELALPPLRERRDDIPLLCAYFLQQISEREGQPKKTLTPRALARLCAHRMPGNVRQLEHLLMNACVMSTSERIDASDLALWDDGWSDGEAGEAPGEDSGSAQADVADSQPATNLVEWKSLEKKRILEALEENQWNRIRAAEQLGIPRRTFYRRLKDYGIL